MKNKHLTTFRGLICVFLSLILVCGTTVSSFPAVTVDLAETEAAAGNSLVTTDGTEYYIGSENSNYLLVRVSGNWHVKRTTDNNYITALGLAGITWGSSNPLSFSATYSNGSYKLSASNFYLQNNPPASAIGNSYAATPYTLYETSSPEPTEPPTEEPTEAPTEPPTEAPIATDANIVTIFFTNSHNGSYWGNVYAYAWSDADASVKNADWPGEAATYYGNNDSNQGLYAYAVDVNKYDRLIFNDGTNNDANKTEDILIQNLAAQGYNAVYFTYDNSYYVTWYTYTYTSEPTITEITDGTLDDGATYYCGTNDGQYRLVNVGTNTWKIQRKSDDYYAVFNGRTAERSWTANGGTVLTEGTHISSHNFPGWRFSFVQNNITYYVYYDPSSNFVTASNDQYGIPVYEVSGGGSGSGSGGSGSGGTEIYSFSVSQKLTNDGGTTWTDTSANTITQSASTGITAGSNVVLSQTEANEYMFLGWFVDGIEVSTDSEVTFSNIRTNYPSTNSQNSSSVLAVEARYKPAVFGSYIFQYGDRYSNTRTKTVQVKLCEDEIAGYSGNNNQANVPTYIWNEASQALYTNNPLLTAAMSVQGNIEEELNASVYKNDIAWGISDSGATNIAFDATNHTVTVTATVTPKTFTFKYVLPGGSTPVQGATNIPYGNVATFNSAYNGVSGCHYINVEIPSTVTYWSADAAGTILLTTNRTFGMVIRGGYTETDLENNVVTAYAQTGAVPNTENKVWKPFVEEATLTRSVDDVSAENKLYADYMINYFNVNGDAVQDLLSSNNSIKYGLIVMKADSAATQPAMESALTKMITAEKTSAYIGDREHIAYRYEYGDATHISNFNRTLYTVSGSYSSLQGKTLTAMAYIIVDGTTYYSPINTDLSVAAG